MMMHSRGWVFLCLVLLQLAVVFVPLSSAATIGGAPVPTPTVPTPTVPTATLGVAPTPEEKAFENAEKEIVDSEAAMLKDLQRLHQRCVLPMLAHIALYPKDQQAMLHCAFDGIKPILDLHTHIAAELHDPTKTESVEEKLAQFVPQLETLDGSYTQHYTMRIKCLQALTSHKTTSVVLTNLGVSAMDLNGMTITVVQRLPRYKILLDAVDKFCGQLPTCTGTIRHTKIKMAVKGIAEMLGRVNSGTVESNPMKKDKKGKKDKASVGKKPELLRPNTH